MPTYDYVCDKCGHKFEKFQSMSSAPVRKCPECGKNAVRRLIGTGAGLIFKGSGFYITDYRDPSYAEKAKADTGAAPAEKSGSESAKPPEAKPAAQAQPAEPKSPAKSESSPSPASDSKPRPAAKPASKSAAKSKR